MKDLSPSKIVSLIKKKEISIEEVLESFYQRIEDYNGALNAIVSLKDREQVLSEQDKVSKTHNNQENQILYGLPLAIKDLVDVSGLPTTYGIPRYKNNIPKKNSIMVERLINSGAIIIGKTNTPELGLGSHTFNRVFGITGNAYDISKSAGGSSGGAASAVAGGLIPIADGSDMMGSCRNPAAFANIYGIRPSPGLIPQERSGIRNNLPILSTLGCLGRTPDDIALMLDVVSGKHPLDPFSVSPMASFRHHHLSNKEFSATKIGWLSNFNGYYKVERGIIDLCESSLRNLSLANIEVEEIIPKNEPSKLWMSWKILRSKVLFDELSSWNLREEDKVFQVKWELERGIELGGIHIEKAMNERRKWEEEIGFLFNKFDFITLPSAQMFPFDKTINFPSEINGEHLDSYHKWMEIVILPSLLGLPTVSVPVGFNKMGLPMGMQVIAKRGDDLKLIAFSKKYEEVFESSKTIPDLTKIH